MWTKIFGYIPPGWVWVCAGLSVVVPLVIYYFNKKLHKLGDPPWKTDVKEK